MKKIIKWIISLLIALNTLNVVRASNEEKDFLYGYELSEETKEMLEKGGASVTDDSVIELQEAFSENGTGKAIIVTNTGDPAAGKSVVLVVNCEDTLAIDRLKQLAVTAMTYEKVRYAAIGRQYTYPGFALISSSNYTYTITAEKNNPSASTIYQTSSPYSTSRVIYAPDTGGLTTGVYLTFTQTVNGTTWSCNLTI